MVRRASGRILGSAVVAMAIAFGAHGTVAEEERPNPAPEATGYITGEVRLTPMCPVARADVPCPVPPEAYASREVILRKAGKVVARTRPDPQGRYRLDVAAGNYVVDINYAGVDVSNDVPRETEVRAGETTRVDITIDTGMR